MFGFVGAAVLGGIAPPAQAQIVSVSAIRESTPLMPQASDEPVTRNCFRGRPRPTCDRFWLTEVGAARSLNPKRNNEQALYTWELGYMENVAEQHAVGAAALWKSGVRMTVSDSGRATVAGLAMAPVSTLRRGCCYRPTVDSITAATSR